MKQPPAAFVRRGAEDGDYRTWSPGAASGANRTRTLSFPSASVPEEARIIPWLSTPQSTAGLRLATSTTCLPVRSSGSVSYTHLTLPTKLEV